MPNNDIDVIIFKILSYLYEKMKSGEEADLQEFSWESKTLSIPQKYWCDVICILVEKGFIEGFSILKTKDGTHIQTTGRYKITYEGSVFLRENSRMKKVKEICWESYKVILSTVVGSIIM